MRPFAVREHVEVDKLSRSRACSDCHKDICTDTSCPGNPEYERRRAESWSLAHDVRPYSVRSHIEHSRRNSACSDWSSKQDPNSAKKEPNSAKKQRPSSTRSGADMNEFRQTKDAGNHGDKSDVVIQFDSPFIAKTDKAPAKKKTRRKIPPKKIEWTVAGSDDEDEGNVNEEVELIKKGGSKEEEEEEEKNKYTCASICSVLMQLPMMLHV